MYNRTPYIYKKQYIFLPNLFLDKVENRIMSFGRLPKGWDFGYGEPITQDVINISLRIYALGKKLDLGTEPIPETEGGITLVFQNGDRFLDVTITPELTFNVRIEKGIGRNYDTEYEKEDVDESHIFRLMNFLAPNRSLWYLSEPLIDLNISKAKEGFMEIPSPRIKMEEYRYSTQFAQI